MLARFLTNVKLRAGPSTSSESVATYKSGETVKYDKTVNNEGRLWISYIGNSGNRRYCCAIDTNGEKYIDLGNNSSNNNNNSGGNAQTVLASYFSDKTVKIMIFMMGDYIMLNYPWTLLKKILKL